MRPANAGWQEESRDLSPGLGQYPLNFEPFLDNGHFALKDRAGLPIQLSGNFILHNYSRLCGWALANWSRYLATRSGRYLEPVLQVANYLINTGERSEIGLVLRNDVPGRGHVGSVSSINQGQAISVLLRAFRATKDNRFLNAAVHCLGAYHRSVDEGGIVSHDLGPPWFEEYPARPLLHVLNGMIFAVVGLSELAAELPESGANPLCHQGLASLETLASCFDIGWWSAYGIYDDFKPRVASMAYHNHSLHIAQLQALGKRTRSPVFSQLAQAFAAYTLNPIYRVRAGVGLLRAKLRIEFCPR